VPLTNATVILDFYELDVAIPDHKKLDILRRNCRIVNVSEGQKVFKECDVDLV
jgi:hypothetical protein